MKIQDSYIDLNSKSTSLELQRKMEFVKTSKIQNHSKNMIVDVDYIYEKKVNGKSNISTKVQFTTPGSIPEIDESLTPKEQVAKFLLEYIFGVKIEVNFYKIFEKEKEKQKLTDALNNQANNINFQLDRIEFNERFESDIVNYSAEGNFKTKDGLFFKFTLNIQVKREFYSDFLKTSSNFGEHLVIKIDNSTIESNKLKYQFNIEEKRPEGKINTQELGNVFLEIDNYNNIINNEKSEPLNNLSNSSISNSGSRYISNNEVIDEQDEINDILKILNNTINRKDLFSSLKDNDIRAIFLNLAKSKFQEDKGNCTKEECLNTKILEIENGLFHLFHKINFEI